MRRNFLISLGVVAALIIAPIAAADMPGPRYLRGFDTSLQDGVTIPGALGLTPAQAQTPAPQPPSAPMTTPPSAVNTPPPGTQTAIAPAATVQVSSKDTVVSIGSIASDALQWVLTIFSAAIGTALTALLVKFLQGVGISVSDARRARLQQLVETGLAFASSKVSKTLDGKIPLDVKSTVVADTIKYVQEHGTDTLKGLGLAPQSNLAVQAIEARTEAALVDPAVPIEIAPAPAAPAAAPAVHDKLADIEATLKSIVSQIKPGGAPGTVG